MLTPISKADWNYQKAAHLLNRAGFGGSPAEIERLAQMSPEAAVAALFDFDKAPAPASAPEWSSNADNDAARFRDYQQADPERKRELRKAEQRAERERIEELRYWWLQRMAAGPCPLQEKLTLFWHGHFATSAQKVRQARLMWRQNDIFRQHGAGNWLNLLTEVSKDPAMLLWLDQAQSRKQHPNENFAREVMELFALGEGNYTEQDITEAARAFTGWTVERPSFQFRYQPRLHDPGEKTIFGKTARFNGDDVLKLIVEQPQASRFIARKLWVFFASENPSDELVAALARNFQSSGQEFRPLLRTIFLSQEFYARDVVRQQVKSPVQWLIGSVKMLERDLPEARQCSGALRLLGQDLLLPPNVKGWDGGLSWITTGNLLNRYNFTNYLVLGEPPGRSRENRRPGRVRKVPGALTAQAERLFPESTRADKKALASALQKRFLQGELSSHNQSTLLAYLESQGKIDDLDVLHGIRLVMSTPEYQLA